MDAGYSLEEGLRETIEKLVGVSNDLGEMIERTRRPSIEVFRMPREERTAYDLQLSAYRRIRDGLDREINKIYNDFPQLKKPLVAESSGR